MIRKPKEQSISVNKIGSFVSIGIGQSITTQKPFIDLLIGTATPQTDLMNGTCPIIPHF